MQRRPQRVSTVSRQYTSSFSNIDWGYRSSQVDISATAENELNDDNDDDMFEYPRVDTSQKLTEEVAEVAPPMISLQAGNEELLRSTVVSQESAASADTTTTTATAKKKKRGPPPQKRPLLTALNSFKGSLRGMFVPHDDNDNEANNNHDNNQNDDDGLIDAPMAAIDEAKRILNTLFFFFFAA
mmetsp:Transcript_19204/g.32393  ORF Transcript_19204/g.32393 Transcript_19204/m.32393 type:complete len:184 (+) Transcript_19204:114-665(+)